MHLSHVVHLLAFPYVSYLRYVPVGCRSYTQPLPTAEDYTKEPPPAPAHLQLTLLNVPPAMDATAQLPRPQHVVLNHTYCQRASPQVRQCQSDWQ